MQGDLQESPVSPQNLDLKNWLWLKKPYCRLRAVVGVQGQSVKTVVAEPLHRLEVDLGHKEERGAPDLAVPNTNKDGTFNVGVPDQAEHNGLVEPLAATQGGARSGESCGHGG